MNKNECLIDFETYPRDLSEFMHQELEDAYDLHRERCLDELVHAMRTRVLTPEEEERAHRHGFGLVMQSGFHSQEEQLRHSRELNDLWFQQRRLQALERGVLLP